MATIIEQLKETTAFIQNIYSGKPRVGIVLGSGLGNLVNEMEIEQEIPYAEMPHFPVVTVKGHGGKLIFGHLKGTPVVAMAGRFHYYEGYSMAEVVFPIRVMKFLGISTLILTNAAGGMNPDFSVGDLMIIRDHINLHPEHPLRGANLEELGPRFPDMSEPYSLSLIAKAKEIAGRLGIHLYEGVYAGVQGPTFETRAEYKYLRTIGGDAVGMSTVPEVIAAIHMGLPVFAMSVITDIGIRDEENVITHDEVLQAAKEAEPRFTAIVAELTGALGQE